MTERPGKPMTTAAGTPRPDGPGRRLDRKLGHIAAGRYTPADFVIADARDADMAFGLAAGGPVDDAPGSRHRTRAEYLGAMRALAAQGELDILLASASNGERLAEEGSLADTTLAIRANDSTDIWSHRGGCYPALPSRPFRTADLTAIRPFCDLVLYSLTFNNDLDRDLAMLEAYRTFRQEAAALDIRHFLEVFNPNAPAGLAPGQVGAFVNDSIMRTLAGVTRKHRPLFLKVAYNGSDMLAELAGHDASVVVGVLGGSAGTTRDTPSPPASSWACTRAGRPDGACGWRSRPRRRACAARPPPLASRAPRRASPKPAGLATAPPRPAHPERLRCFRPREARSDDQVRGVPWSWSDFPRPG
jgi:hypothetical protein